MVQYIVTIVMGTVIGYGTNYLAVKMMFRPKTEVKLFGRTLPFTPGVIPKQKDKLAGAIGSAVGTSLLTKEDIKSKLTGIKGEIIHLIASVFDIHQAVFQLGLIHMGAQLEGVEGHFKIHSYIV